MGLSKSSSKREVYSNSVSPPETRKISNKKSKFRPKRTRKRRMNKAKISKRKEIIKVRGEINEIETKKN